MTTREVVVPSAWSVLRPSHYVSYRRHLLDAHLEWAAPLMRGLVVDLGGKRGQTRGRFRPPSQGVTAWIYVNVVAHAHPSVIASAMEVPLRDACADCVICTEVLEHLEDPKQCVREAFRVLKPGGVFIGSVPFMYPVHGDPADYQRFTADGLRRLVSPFGTVDVRAMGGYFGTLGLFIEVGLERFGGRALWRRIARRLLATLARVLVWADVRKVNSTDGVLLPGFANGHFFVARR